MTKPIIKTAATTLDEASIIDVLVRANWADPAARWAWPESQQFLMHFPSFVRAFGGKAFAHGSAYYVDGYVGAALWLPPDIATYGCRPVSTRQRIWLSVIATHTYPSGSQQQTSLS